MEEKREINGRGEKEETEKRLIVELPRIYLGKFTCEPRHIRLFGSLARVTPAPPDM